MPVPLIILRHSLSYNATRCCRIQHVPAIPGVCAFQHRLCLCLVRHAARSHLTYCRCLPLPAGSGGPGRPRAAAHHCHGHSGCDPGPSPPQHRARPRRVFGGSAHAPAQPVGVPACLPPCLPACLPSLPPALASRPCLPPLPAARPEIKWNHIKQPHIHPLPSQPHA